MESKNERFRRLATTRGDRLIREIVLLGNLSNTKNYSYSEEEVEQLFAPIEEELRSARAKFQTQTGSTRRIQFDD